jgi:hypothetical protein
LPAGVSLTRQAAKPGLYVIEISLGVIKVGLSEDTDRRIATHIRNARGLGADPYRYESIPCAEHLLRLAESTAHRVVRAMGGIAQAHTPEVFTGVYFNPVLLKVMSVVDLVNYFDDAVDRLTP